MSVPSRAEVVIVGAGIAGISAAYQLTLLGIRDILIVDPGPPLSMTSDKSTECYRNWWPGPDAAMTQMMNRSIDLLESLALETENAIHLNRRGYLFVTRRSERVEDWRQAAAEACEYGAGRVREHASGIPGDSPDGVDLLLDATDAFPFLPPGSSAMHIRRAGWLKSDLLGRTWLDRAREAGVQVIRAKLIGIAVGDGRVSGAVVETNAGGTFEIGTSTIVNAAGPMAGEVAGLAGVDLPVRSELHLKLNFRDEARAMPRDAPLVIGDDPVELDWDADDRAALAADSSTRFLTQPFPAGVHGRPEGDGDSTSVLLLWTYHLDPVAPVFPFSPPPYLAEVVLRGMAQVIPAFGAYRQSFPAPIIDGGYYTKTPENRPLIGPTDVPGFWLCCGLSGYGIMAAAACGELLAAQIANRESPSYASAFRLDRYKQPGYAERVLAKADTSQL